MDVAMRSVSKTLHERATTPSTNTKLVNDLT